MIEPSTTPSAHVRTEWSRRVEAEYCSAAITQHFALWLIQLGASPDLIRDALVIVDDELTHSEMSDQVYRAAGGDAQGPIAHERLGLSRNETLPLEIDALLTGVRVFCLGETVAVRLFQHLRSGCTQEAPRRTLDRILVDEVRHRDFGWDFLDWMLDRSTDPQLPAKVSAVLPHLWADLERSYGASAPGQDAFREPDREWGLAPAHEYADIVARTRQKDFIPRFSQRGIVLTATGAQEQ